MSIFPKSFKRGCSSFVCLHLAINNEAKVRKQGSCVFEVLYPEEGRLEQKRRRIVRPITVAPRSEGHCYHFLKVSSDMPPGTYKVSGSFVCPEGQFTSQTFQKDFFRIE